VIVVDNGSSKETRRVVAAFEGLANLRYVSEPVPGLCRARNRGWRSARGRYVAFLDDDAVACSAWVSAIVRAFATCPAAGAVGGRVDPIWMAPRPPWLSDHVARALTIVNWSSEPKALPDLNDQWLVGANMAVRSDLLPAVGGFRPELDRVGRHMLSSGDIYLLKGVARTGATCLYYPAMTVEHPVPPERLTKRWFRRRYYWQGVSDAVMEVLERQPTRRERRRAGLRALRGIALSPARATSLLPTNDPERFAETCWTLIDLGRAVWLLGGTNVGAPLPSA
jgi:glycosyltransferase involved in cell wall biosynthesis